MDIIRTLGAALCNPIYQLIAILYDLFMKVSRVELLTNDYIQPIYQRITMILTIVMVFYVTFEMVKFVVQPDGFADKEKGAPKIVLRMVLVVILIAFVPRIFGIAYQVQNKIFDTQIFSKVILGTSATKTDQLGKNLSHNIFSMFYYVNDEIFTAKQLEQESNCEKIPCKQLVSLNLYKLQQEGKIPLLNSGLNSKGNYTEPSTGETVKEYYIVFNWFFAVLVGGFIAYILLLYCIDVGVRVVQLLYLQIIAPIPIMGYLSPKKDGIFEKWTKQCVTTYLDLFLRTGIIYFILLICEILGKGLMDGKLTGEAIGGNLENSVFIVLIMGLLLFAHKMPKMLGELFPKMGAASGNFGLKAGERVAPEAARAIGATLGAKRAIGGMLSRGISRHIRNKANGAHSIFSAEGRKQARQRRENRHTRNQLKDTFKKDSKDSQNIRNRVSDEMVEKAKNQVKTKSNAFNAAKKELEDATKSGDQQRIANAQKKHDMAKAELKQEAESYNKMMRARNGITDDLATSKQETAKARHNLNLANQELAAAKTSKDPNAIAQAQAKVDAAQADLNAKEQNLNQELSKNSGSEIVQRWEQMKSTKDDMERTKNELNAAIQNGDETAIEKAKAKYAVLEQKYTAEAESYKRITSTTQNEKMMENLKAKLDDAESQVAEDNNTRYKSSLGAAAWGAVAGGVTGALGGAKATKLEEVVSKAKDGAQKDVKTIQALNKYIDDGGDARVIPGFVDRTMAKVEKNVGVETAYVRKNLANQTLEKEIKEIDSSMQRADNVKKEFDATEDRIKSKLNDNKVKASSNKDFEHKDGTKFTVEAGTDYAEVSRTYKAAAKTANDVSTEASKKLQEKETQISSLTSDQRTNLDNYLNGQNVTLTQEETAALQNYQDYKKAKEEANRKSQDAVKADREAAHIEKIMTRAIFTEMLNDPKFESNSNFDGVARQSLQRNYNEIKIANQDIELRTRLQKSLSAVDYEAFINCRFKDYNQLDAVLVALNTARNDLSIDKQSKQDQKHRNESSKATQADKAATDFNGSGK